VILAIVGKFVEL